MWLILMLVGATLLVDIRVTGILLIGIGVLMALTAPGRFYLGHWIGNEPAMQEVKIEAGQRVRVVMASRFGDVGITTRLQDRNGYMLRVPVEALENFSVSSG